MGESSYPSAQVRAVGTFKIIALLFLIEAIKVKLGEAKRLGKNSLRVTWSKVFSRRGESAVKRCLSWVNILGAGGFGQEGHCRFR